MTDRPLPDELDDETLLRHFRQQATGEPPASLDALILAAAHQATPLQLPQPSLWQRWLAACQRPRWQMGFATVAGVALMLGLVLRTPVPALESSATFAPAPAPAPAPAVVSTMSPPMPAPAAPMARLREAPRADAYQAEEQADSLASTEVLKSPSQSKHAPAAQSALQQALREILRLREAGAWQAADEKLLALHQRFPREDLPRLLEALRQP